MFVRHRHFVLEIKSKSEAGGPKAQAWLAQHTDPDLPNQQAVMIHVPPSALSSASRSKSGDVTGEIGFFLDQSNSMEDKIGSLTKANDFYSRISHADGSSKSGDLAARTPLYGHLPARYRKAT